MSDIRPRRKRARDVRTIDPTMFAVQKLRKGLLWIIPLFSAAIAGCFWMTAEIMVPTILDIAYRAPAVQVTPGMLVSPFLAALLILGMVVGGMRAIPLNERIVKPVEQAMIIVMLGGFVGMWLVPITGIAQHFFMPSLGYYPCNILRGNPNKWSNDWVLDTQWCVKGQTIEWVKEQARSAVTPGASR
ncbi:hypothetical protein [Acidovorax sp. BLS4]|uniref:hypothetical protein n=1 Tax=Acidovorax sp. BLS4 TaxID=3273430 RepID=UPI002942E6C6|nr:hypothetical protein [Paracidovorax avenae]WOI46023.1 hypothetical protein R1Z03_02065 [Paracidovorax avenae]